MSTEAANTSAPSQKGGPWIPLESNPEVFTAWAEKVGVAKTHAHFEDVYGLDAEPVKALLLIYPITTDVEKRRKEDDEKLKKEGVAPDVDTSVIWIQQKISNACGTIGLLHALLNSNLTTTPKSALATFREQAIPLSPSDRADLLAKTTLFAEVHQEAATSAQSSSAVPTNLDTDLHFTCFIQAPSPKTPGEKRILEMDGRRAGPIDRGVSKDFLKDVAKVVQDKYLSMATSLNFGIVALCGTAA
ncbi:ubiquitinyl hydrolase 1 [Tulasnella sp. 424]|nr:ubiquitinyl hydrolase 1 [Tulasnella sp. 424]KAG8974499.1 ubiquitinyl hydrolase 1 [Tulasnella sp. 425]